METGSPKDHPEIWEGVQGGIPDPEEMAEQKQEI